MRRLQMFIVAAAFFCSSSLATANSWDHFNFEKVLSAGVPEDALKQAIDFFEVNKTIITNKRYITIIDFSLHSGQKRFFVIDQTTGDVEALHTAHGKGSDPEHDGVARIFGKKPNSNMTSLGFYLTAETYYGKHGLALRLDGLEDSNDTARDRAIVIHGATYVDPRFEKMGRSFGCPALAMNEINRIVETIKDGSLLYAYHPDYN